MKKRNNVIIILSLVAIALFCFVELIVLPQQRAQAESYKLAQQEPTTHDLASILTYKSKYMGDASNSGNLFHKLPLSEYLDGFEQDPTAFELTVNYKKYTSEIGTEKLQKVLIYNSTAAFALIDNLKTIQYHFTDHTYVINRKDVEELYSVPKLANLLNQSSWKQYVQDKLKDSKQVQTIFAKIEG